MNFQMLLKFFVILFVSTTSFNLAFTMENFLSIDFEWSPEELIKLRLISNVELSPDHSTTLFVAAQYILGEKKGKTVTQIYQSRFPYKENAYPFTCDQHSSYLPKWSPNGKWVAFLSDREGIYNLYLIRANGGETMQMTHQLSSIKNFQWSPDGNKIAFVCEDTVVQKEVTSSLAYEFGKNEKINRLFLLHVFSNRIEPLTSDQYCIRCFSNFTTENREFDWSPCSQKIAFAYNSDTSLNNYYKESHIAQINIYSKKVHCWEKKEDFEALPRYSNDGKLIAYLSSTCQLFFAFNRQLAIRNREGTFIKFLSPTLEEGAYIRGPSILGWTRDDQSILYFEPKNTTHVLTSVPINDQPSREINTKQCFFSDPVLSHDRTMISFVNETINAPPEACISQLDIFYPQQVSNLNQNFLKKPLFKNEIVTWQSTDRLKIEGILTYPLNYDAQKKYPLITMIHGGPMGFVNESFLGTFAEPYALPTLAEKGFFIFRPNFRGSCGYGKEFRCANYLDWGGRDYDDIIAGIDSLIDRGLVDSEKLGVMGWSYGGYMAAWMISQTDRFKAASLGAGIYNLQSMSGTNEATLLLPSYLKHFTENAKLYSERSPINFVASIKTPCLIQHGIEDHCVPVSQAYELFHALEYCGNKPKLILYPKVGHNPNEPNIYLAAMKSNIEWFEKLLID